MRESNEDESRPPTPFIRNIILEDYDTKYPWEAVYSPSDYFRENTSKDQILGDFSEYGKNGKIVKAKVRVRRFRSIDASYASHQVTATNSLYEIAELPEQVYVFAGKLMSALVRLQEQQNEQTLSDVDDADTAESGNDAGIYT